jgi:hypothetical protein
MFQFPEVLDIKEGDVLQQNGARRIWRVTELVDDVVGGVFNHFEARVEKFEPGKASKEGASHQSAIPGTHSHVVINAPIHGGLQLVRKAVLRRSR